MPEYDLYCPNCGFETEVTQSISESFPECPECDTKMEVKFNKAPSIQFKGSGFHAYQKSEKEAEEKAGKLKKEFKDRRDL